jgi:hypothetical protein
MSEMPAQRKPADKRQNRVTKSLEVAPHVSMILPDPPPDLGKEAVEAWYSYWSDSRSNAAETADKSVITRWVSELNRYHISVRAADNEPLVEGSQGQQVENPLYKIAYRAQASANGYEQQLGIGALNAMKLGIAKGDAVRSLSDLNRDAEVVDGDDDPRLAIIDGTALA